MRGPTVADLNEEYRSRNPYRHDHNPLNEDFHGGICAACEWETDDVGIPSVDVCSFCADPECDGIGCIGSLDSNETADHDTIEQLHDLIRAGAAWKIMQTHGYVVAERALAHAEHRAAHEFGVEGAEPVTWREWQVISDDGGGVSFSVNVLDFDSERGCAMGATRHSPRHGRVSAMDVDRRARCPQAPRDEMSSRRGQAAEMDVARPVRPLPVHPDGGTSTTLPLPPRGG